MNQVYFYELFQCHKAHRRRCLNPFMNQVYFYKQDGFTHCFGNLYGLNPFMNQVYFYNGPQRASIIYGAS